MMGGVGETVEARPGHSGGLGKPGGDEYISKLSGKPPKIFEVDT